MPPKPRRQRGTGALYKTSTGQWRAAVDLGVGPDGKRRRRVVVGKDKATVQRKLAEVRKQVEATGDSPPQQTVKDWLTYWLDNIAARRVRPRTLQAYRGYVNNWLIPQVGRRKLTQLAPQHVRALHKAMTDAGLTSTSALHAHHILAKALSDAEREGLVLRNVARLVDPPARAVSEVEGLELDAALALLRYLAGPPPHPLGSRFAAALLTGARQGELLGLEVDRVHIEDDRDAGWIDLSWQLQRLPKSERLPAGFEHRHLTGGLYLTRPKSKAGTRVVPLAPPLAAILRRHLAATPGNRYGLVWARPDGEPIDPRQDWGAWQDAKVAAGLPRGPLHAARHTTATLLLEAGVDAHVIMSILGHSQVVTTRGYQKVRQPMAQDAMNRLGALVALD